MSILIIGSEGSMGKRYQAILRYLNRSFVCADKQMSGGEMLIAAQRSEGIIIATPTDTHGELIKCLAPLSKPILCEKPIDKDPDQFHEIMEALKAFDTPFRMMMQYEMLISTDSIGHSHYDYFRHGNDGLYWDCMQIIALARGSISIRESSPVWSCKINGKPLNLAHMDAAYIGYVQKWFNKPSQNLAYLEDIHQKVRETEKKSLNVH